MRVRFFVLAFTLLGSAAVAADSWPGFRGPTADGHSDARNVPTSWSEKDNINWKSEIHGKGWSSPVVLGKQVWVTTADEVLETDFVPKKGGPPPHPVKEVSLFAMCLDRETGKVIHDIKLGTQEKPQYCHPFNSYASSTPFLEEGRLYAHFGALGTWCVDTKTGKTLWVRRDLKCDHFRGAASSPVVYGDLLYLIFDGFDLQYVCALDKTSGKTIWKTDRKIKYSSDNGDIKKAYATPVLFEMGGRQELVCPSAECTIAYDPKTGAELWRIAHGGMNGSARAVMGGGKLYLTSGHTGKLLAVKADAKPNAAGMLMKDSVVWEVSKAVPSRPSLLLDGELLFMVSDGGIASCLEAATGKMLWSERLGSDEFSASPVFANGHLFFCSQNGKTFVLEAGKTFNVVSENRLEGRFMASPAIAGSQVFLRTNTNLYSIGKQ